MTLRLARIDDIDMILDMARRFHESSPYAGIEFSEKKIEELFAVYLTDPSKMIVILSEQDEYVRGMVVGFCDTPPFSEEKVCTEIAWWMDEEYRGTRDSMLLKSAYEDWGKRVGASLVQMALLSTSPDVSRIYEKSGFSLTEKTYMKRI